MAPALINVFMCVVYFVQSGNHSRSIGNYPPLLKSPKILFLKKLSSPRGP